MPQQLHDPYCHGNQLLEKYNLLLNLNVQPKVHRRYLSRKTTGPVLSALPGDEQISLCLSKARIQIGLAFERHQGNADAVLLEIYGRRFQTGAYPSLLAIVISKKIFPQDFQKWYLTIALFERSFTSYEKALPALNFSDWFFRQLYIKFTRSTEAQGEKALTVIRMYCDHNYTGREIGSFMIRCLRNSALKLETALVMDSAQPRLGSFLHRNGWVRIRDNLECDTWLDPQTLPKGSAIERRMTELWGKGGG